MSIGVSRMVKVRREMKIWFLVTIAIDLVK